MNTVRRFVIAGLTLFLGASATVAQDKPAVTPGGFETQGSVTAGYRFIDVAGRRQKYEELFDLRKGFRVNEFDLSGRAANNTNALADSYSVSASGIGGEPYSGGQVSMSKLRAYDLRVNFRQSYKYWNRNDEQPHPGGLSGLTINHDWAVVRKFGSANLSVNATENLRFNFEFHRNTREGATFTTRTLDYFGFPSAWANFLRANPYYLQAPVNEVMNRFSGGLSYAVRDWNFFYRTGYQTYEENLTMNNVQAGQRSIALSDPVTANELISNASWTQYRRLRTPISEFSYVGNVRSRFQLRGGYIFYRYRGPVSQDASFNGTARLVGTTVGPYAVSQSDRAHVTEPNHVIDQGFTVKLAEMWNFHADYRYSRFTQEAVLEAHSLRDATTAASGEEETHWRYGLQTLDVAFEFLPSTKVVVRPGVRLMKRDVHASRDGVGDPRESRPSKLIAPILNVYFGPTRRFSIRGNIQHIANGGPYTRISPRTDFVTRWIGRYQLADQLSIENALIVRTGKWAATDFRNAVRSNQTSISYAFNDRLSLFGGFGYDSFLATASITFLRGTAPLSAVWRDQTINRVWQAGIDARPVPRLSLRLSGNYVRTTGAGEISGEPPTFGPLRWPMVTGTLGYDFGIPGRFSVDLQRTYYIEEIMHGDNFSANILALHWTKDF
jgi:hypothetical protein